MTWIKTFDPMGAPGPLREAFLAQAKLYPREYATSTHPGVPAHEKITASHSLLPEALFHAFATFGAAMAPELPLERRHHEMIATVVSVTNRCRY
jgi:alkylhydroperoxidase family enzyme